MKMLMETASIVDTNLDDFAETIARDGVRFSLAEMTEPKVVCWYLPGLRPE